MWSPTKIGALAIAGRDGAGEGPPAPATWRSLWRHAARRRVTGESKCPRGPGTGQEAKRASGVLCADAHSKITYRIGNFAPLAYTGDCVRRGTDGASLLRSNGGASGSWARLHARPNIGNPAGNSARPVSPRLCWQSLAPGPSHLAPDRQGGIGESLSTRGRCPSGSLTSSSSVWCASRRAGVEASMPAAAYSSTELTAASSSPSFSNTSTRARAFALRLISSAIVQACRLAAASSRSSSATPDKGQLSSANTYLGIGQARFPQPSNPERLWIVPNRQPYFWWSPTRSRPSCGG
jgi:hypothetical protein